MWKKGKTPSWASTSQFRDLVSILYDCMAFATRLRWVSETPLGRPVVPFRKLVSFTFSSALH